MNPAHWEHFEHKADIGIRGFGDTRADAFAQAAIAMSAVITDIGLIKDKHEVAISCNAADDDTLLYDWLNTLIYEMATRRMLFRRFDVNIVDGNLDATAFGEAIDVQRHQPVVEIKGATYTELSVYRENDQWIAQCVVDV